MTTFEKSFTQQEAISEEAIAAVGDILRSGRLHRYNVGPGETSEAAALEAEYAAWQGARYCLACTSGGYALQIALRAAGLKPGEQVLANAWTLAPVPGAIFAAGGVPAFVEIDMNLHIDLDDLDRQAEATGARFLMLSHMRGHIGDMDAIQEICERRGVLMIEDCAHTMAARWKGARSGAFGKVACFSTQTYKHINTGEGGLLTTDDAEIAARATILSGSYMLYDRHGAGPDQAAFDAVRLETPNCSGRMDNLRAAIARAQIPALEDKAAAWTARYRAVERELRAAPGLETFERPQHEAFVGSSIQFRAKGVGTARMSTFIENLARRGVEIKWFGEAEPRGFTSRYDSWRYLKDARPLPKTLNALAELCDMRIPLTFSEDDCATIGRILKEEAAAFV